MLGQGVPLFSLPRAIPALRRPTIGFTLVELVVVLAVMGIVTGLALPHLRLEQYRSDAAAQQVRSVFQTAQRTSLTRQYDVIVTVDTVRCELRIAEDKNNNGVIDAGEDRVFRPEGEGNRFSVPPVGVNSPTVTASVVGAQLKSLNSMPSAIFHRDGSVSSDMEVYISSTARGQTSFRAVTVTRSTGRAELYRLSGTGSTASWQLAAL